MRAIVGGALAFLLAAGATATAGPSSYAGLEKRPLKALSAEQTNDLLAGRGMGLALAAELNGYPGPRHVLDLAGELALSPAQRAETEALFQAMRAEAVAIGREVVAREAALDRLFAEGRADEPAVARLTEEIGRLQGALRLAHLRAHVRMKALLTADQAGAYERLRGYAADGGHGQGAQPGHRHGG